MTDIRASQLSLDVLNADATAPALNLSAISLDVLRVQTGANEVWFSQVSLDVLRVPTTPTGALVAVVNGVDHSSDHLIIRDTLVIVDELNEAPNTCDFTTRATIFTVGTRVVFYLDTADPSTQIYAGTVLSVRHVREHIGLTGFYEVHCVSDEWLFDKQIINGRYPEQSATALVTFLVNAISALDGSEFTALHVQAGLPTIQGGYEAVNMRPSQILTEIAVLAGCYWYIENKDVHFFTEESAVTQPIPLTTGNTNFSDFELLTDYTQIRTVVTVEGKSTTAPNAVAIGQTTLIVEDGTIFSASGGLARIGPNAFSYESVMSTGTGDDTVWTVTGIPAVNDPGAGDLAIVVTHAAGQEVVIYYQLVDAAAVSVLQGLEGGTGVHTHLVQDSSLTVDALQARAVAELAAFSAPIVSIAYKTRDLNTRAGRTVSVTLPSPYSLEAESFMIQRVTIRDFQDVDVHTGSVYVYPPRFVEASPVRLTTIIDLFTSVENSR